MHLQAGSHLDEYNEMLDFILKWIEKAKILVHSNITWNSATQLRDQFMSHQVVTHFSVVSGVGMSLNRAVGGDGEEQHRHTGLQENQATTLLVTCSSDLGSV